MQSDWSTSQSYQLGEDFKPWLWQGGRPYNETSSGNFEHHSALWPPATTDKLQLKENMQFNGSFRPGQFQNHPQYPQSDHWKGEDRTLSPYMTDQHQRTAMPAAASAPSTALYPKPVKGADQGFCASVVEQLAYACYGSLRSFTMAFAS